MDDVPPPETDSPVLTLLPLGLQTPPETDMITWFVGGLGTLVTTAVIVTVVPTAAEEAEGLNDDRSALADPDHVSITTPKAKSATMDKSLRRVLMILPPFCTDRTRSGH